MAHVRTQIRNAATAMLTGLPTTDSRVFASRGYPVRPDQLPALLIYFGGQEGETVERDTMSGQQMRTGTLVVTAAVRLDESADETLDQIAAEVEPALDADVTFGGLAMDAYLSRTTMDFEGETLMFGLMSMEFTVIYQTATGQPETAL